MGKPTDRGPATRFPDEIGVIRKSWQARIRVALVYPNRYHLGMSNLGFQTVYRGFNAMDRVVCERAFLPDRGPVPAGTEPVSRESGRPLRDFDIVAFSLSFENDYPNLLTILDGAGIALTARQRTGGDPLVIAGGIACILNPEPLADFIDCFLMGESETLLENFIDHFDARAPRADLLEGMARKVAGVYVPALYRPVIDHEGGFGGHRPRLESIPARIVQQRHPDLAVSDTCTSVLTTDTTFQRTYLMEVGRGCPHGCRFCSAGFVYRPPRFRSSGQLRATLMQGAALTDRVGLVGAAVSDLPGIDEICRQGAAAGVKVGFSSLRADALSPAMVAALQRSGVKTATLAPDAGSERMRRVINKGVTARDVLAATEQLVAAGIPNIKLYFMIGLPTETDRDIDAIVGLCQQIKNVFLKTSRPRRRMGEISVSLSSFVPKPVTPFQWAAMNDVRALKGKLKTVSRALGKVPNLRVTADKPRWAYLQALLARGDRRVARFLLEAHRNGGNWPQTFKSLPLNADDYALRERGLDEPLPWDIVDHGIDRTFLIREYRRALEGRSSAPCPMIACDRCRRCMPPAVPDDDIAPPA